MRSDILQKEIGIVRANKQYLVTVEGLPSAQIHDIIVNEDGKRALVTALSYDAVEAMILDKIDVYPGQRFEIHPQTNQIAVGEHLFGRVINALGDPIDGKGGFPPKNKPLILEKDAGDLVQRDAIKEQLVTGFPMIDTVLPVGKGQRQLLIGSVRSGTEVFCRNVIRNQVGKNVVCIYATIGKPANYVKRFAEDIFKDKTGEYSIVVASSSEDSAPLITIAPAVALFIAEAFCEQGRDVLLVFDDLYTHAKYLREIALLEGNLPGRESYPGDIFFKQAHLIERAGNFVNKGSITLLPLLQTDIESTTDLIMTNIMGTTDGHFVFSSELYARGIFPPVLEDESVTRVGKHTQVVVQKQLSTAILSLLAEAKEQERYTQFGTQVSNMTQNVINMGSILRTLLNQSENEKLSIETQTILLALVFTSFSTDKNVSFFSENYITLCDAFETKKEFKQLRESVRKENNFKQFLTILESHISIIRKICHE